MSAAYQVGRTILHGSGQRAVRSWLLTGSGGKSKLSTISGGTRRRGPAGVIYAYSNTGYTLLGLIVEQITGQTLAAKVRRRILGPLNLEHTYFEGFERTAAAPLACRYHYVTEAFILAAGVAPSFARVRDGIVDVTGTNLSVEWAAGGMLSSARDLVVFGRAL